MKLKHFLRRAGSAVSLAACAAVCLPAITAKAGGPPPPPPRAVQGGTPLPDLTPGADRLRSTLTITNKTFNANSCSVVEGCISTTGTRRLLQFDLQIENLGNADAVLGTPAQRPDLYVFSPCHGHYHILDSLDYAMSYGGIDTASFYDVSTGNFFLRNSNDPGTADVLFGFGAGGAGNVPVSGDWDGNGTSTVGFYNPATSTFFLKNTNSPGNADIIFSFGAGGAGYVPISGDWDGDGKDSIGLYQPATGVFFLKNTNAAGGADVAFNFGPAGAGLTAIAGDWDGNGTDTVGLYNPATGAFFLKNANTPGGADTSFVYGAGGAVKAIAGDWDANGVDTIGLFDASNGGYYLRNSNSAGAADLAYSFGAGGANQIPIVGDWDYDQKGLTVPGITGLKQAFCWLDSQRVQGTLPSHYNCSNQGITAGWSDVYGRTLDCQWIDITGLAAGNYQLRASVNDTHTIVTESNYDNNSIAVKVHITPASSRPTVPKVAITSPTGPKTINVGDKVTVAWTVENGENVDEQEVWVLPSPKKDTGGLGPDPDADARNAEWHLLAEHVPANVRSFTWTATEDLATQYPVKFLIRTTDHKNMVGTDTFSTGKVKIVK